MSSTIPIQSSTLRVGGYIMIHQYPCKIINMSTNKTGKHGSAKVHFTGIDIFTEQKHDFMTSSTKNVDVPIVERKDYQLIDIDGDIVTYLNDKGESNCDLRMPDFCESDLKLSEELREKFESDEEIYITVLSAVGIDAIKGYRLAKQ